MEDAVGTSVATPQSYEWFGVSRDNRFAEEVSFCFVWTAALFCVPRVNRPAHTIFCEVSVSFLLRFAVLLELDNSFDFDEHAFILPGLGCDLDRSHFVFVV